MKVNPEFEKLIPPLTKEEFEQLEKNILKEGIRDALIAWPIVKHYDRYYCKQCFKERSVHLGDGIWQCDECDFGVAPMEDEFILIDGHNRLKIAQTHGLEYTTIEKEFENEDQVKEWIILNQFGRRNLSAYDRALLALQLENIFSKSAEKRMLGGIPVPKSEQGRTIEKLSDIAGVGKDTIYKVKKIEETATPEQKVKLQTGELSINEAYNNVRSAEKKEIVKQKEEEHKEEISTVSEFDIDIFNTDRKFNIIYADPAWEYWSGGHKNNSLHYSTMTIEEIKNLPVSNITDNNCILFMWVTYPILNEVFSIIESWGFKYSTCGFIWVKKNKNADSYFFGNGAWTRANSELCLIATKGSVTRIDASISQVIEDPVSEHSAKPVRVRELITRLVGELPRVELFSRNKNKDGWFNWGNQI